MDEDIHLLERTICQHEIDTIFHLGAKTIVNTALRNPLDTFETNIRGTYHLLEVCRLHQDLIKRIVIASSDKAYGSSPILHHIMEFYASFGHREFILALGYKSDVIKRYFLDFRMIHNDCSIDLATGALTLREKRQYNWLIHLVDTGLHTQTGGRLKQLKEWIGNEIFLFTYGDGLSNVDIADTIAFHKQHGKLATMTTVRPTARFGSVILENNQILEFTEKNEDKEGWINGGFFVLEPAVLDYIEDDLTAWEKKPLEQLAIDGQLMAYIHKGFWKSMDTLRDQRLLDAMCLEKNMPWKRSSYC